MNENSNKPINRGVIEWIIDDGRSSMEIGREHEWNRLGPTEERSKINLYFDLASTVEVLHQF